VNIWNGLNLGEMMNSYDLIKKLQSLSENNKKKEIVIFAENGLEMEPTIKFLMDTYGETTDKMVITY